MAAKTSTLAACKTLVNKAKRHRRARASLAGAIATRCIAYHGLSPKLSKTAADERPPVVFHNSPYFQRLAAEAEAARQARLERLKAEAKAAEEAGALGLKKGEAD